MVELAPLSITTVAESGYRQHPLSPESSPTSSPEQSSAWKVVEEPVPFASRLPQLIERAVDLNGAAETLKRRGWIDGDVYRL